MEFHTRCLYWFILQVVAIIVCYRGKVSSSTNISQGCVRSRHDLKCPPTKVISVTDIYRGISSCKGASCCIEGSGCPQKLRESFQKSVQKRCDDKQNCSLYIYFAKIPCTSGWFFGRTTIDGYAYERITYICKDDPHDNVTTSVETNTKRYENNTEEDDESEGGQMEDDSSSNLSEIATVVMVIIGIILLIATVVIAVVMYRRRKFLHSNLLHPIELKNMDNGKTEAAIYANERNGTDQPENSDRLPPVYGLSDKAKPTSEEDPTVYSYAEIRKIDWKQNEFDGKTTTGLNLAQNTPTTTSHNTGPVVYTVANKPSSHAAVSSVSQTGIPEKQGQEGLANTGDGFPVRTYRLPSPEVATDIYVNEVSAVTETVTRTPSSQDDEDVTVIENDLYCH